MAAAEVITFETVDRVIVGDLSWSDSVPIMFIAGTTSDGAQRIERIRLQVQSPEHEVTCQRFAMLALTKPGRYRLTVEGDRSTWMMLFDTYQCGLTRID